MRARPFALAALALTASLALAQSTLHGKTHSQVLAMGETEWMSHVADQEGGSSTSGMLDALDFYYSAAYKRNLKLLGKQKRSRRDALKAARTALRRLGNTMILTERTANGGGTMYSLFGPSRAIHIEEALYRILTKKPGPSERVSDEEFARLGDSWATAQRGLAIEEAKSDTEKLIETAKSDSATAHLELSKLPQGERDVLRALMQEWFRADPS